MTANLKLMKYLPALLLICIELFFVTGCKKPGGKDGDQNVTTIQYEQSLEIFPNPERGFIHHLEVHNVGEGLDASQLRMLRQENVSMIMRMYYLEDFKDKPLNDAELLLISNDMQALREAGLKCVVRFAYTDDISGTDAPFSVI